jgi:hypothetical protein
MDAATVAAFDSIERIFARRLAPRRTLSLR